MSKQDEIDRLKRKLDREMRAREDAERLLELESKELNKASARATTLAQAMESAADGIAITDSDGRFIFMNQSHAHMFGFDIDELIGQHWSVLYGEKELKRFETDIFEKFSRDGSWNGETTGQDKDGQPVFQEITLTALETGGLICATRDIASRRRREFVLREMEQKLQEAEHEAAIAVFGQTIAHDLNNLIAVISGYSAILVEKISDSAIKSQVERILQASQQASEVILSMQTTTRMDDSKPSKNTDLTRLIKASLQIAEGLCPEGIDLDYTLEPDVHVFTDEMLLSRCLLNIIKNAFEAIDDHGSVKIQMQKGYLEKTAQYSYEANLGYPLGDIIATIEIKDNGGGMDEATLHRVFDPYYTTKADMGKGLGLQSLKSLTDSDLAYVEVETEPDIGTCFRLYIIAPPLQQDPIPQPPIHAWDPKILVIDDDALVGDMMISMLDHLGYASRFYTSPEEALSSIQEETVDLVISDYNMPIMNGEEFAKQTKAIRPDLPFIIYSAQAATIKAQPLYSAIIAKPVTTEALDRVIKSLIDKN